MWRPWSYHNPIANIAVISMYRQSGSENARFRTEVSITHGVRAERVTSTLTGRYAESETQQALQIKWRDSPQTARAHSPLTITKNI